MQIVDFTIEVHGSEEERTKLAELLRSLPQTSDEYDVIVSLDSILTDVEKSRCCTRQTSLMYRGDFVVEHPDMLVIRGWLKNDPPFLLMLELFRRFSALIFDCSSTTDHELLQHWRIGAGFKDGALIEQNLIDLQKLQFEENNERK